MKHLIMFGLIGLTVLLTSCVIEPQPLSGTVSDFETSNIIEAYKTGQPMSSTVTDPETPYTTGAYTTTKSQSIDETDYTYPFAEGKWTRETAESFEQWSNIPKEKYKVSQINGKLLYTTDFNEEVTIFRHKVQKSYDIAGFQEVDEVDEVFVAYSFGIGSGFGGLICFSTYDEAYNINAESVTDVFTYGDYIYYICCGSECFTGGIRRAFNKNGSWVVDIDFNLNAEVANIDYFIPSNKYSLLQKCYIDENKTYIIASSNIYLFNGEELTSIYNEGIAINIYSVTKIDDSFYIGSDGYIVECNVVTGERYIWVRNDGLIRTQSTSD